MKIRGLIFDLDGVIVSTDNFHYKAWKKLAEREGIYFDKEINNRLRGISRKESLNIILEKANKNYSKLEIDEMLEYKNKIYKESLKHLTKSDILDNFLELYNNLKKIDIKIAIGSSSKNAKLILKQIGLIDCFDAIADGFDITYSKPNPEIFLIASKKLGLEPRKCMVVEDAFSGIEAAKAAGMKAVAIHNAKKSLLADYRIDNLLEIYKLIKGE